MFRIWKTKDAWHLVDSHQTLCPFIYDNIKDLLEDLEFLMEGYGLKDG